MKKYSYQKISVPKEICERSESIMPRAGFRTMTAYVTYALTELNKKIEAETMEVDKHD